MVDTLTSKKGSLADFPWCLITSGLLSEGASCSMEGSSCLPQSFTLPSVLCEFHSRATQSINRSKIRSNRNKGIC